MALTKVSRGLLNTSIVDNGNATAITIDSSENVGIGTSSPSSLMHLSANTGATLTLESTDTGIATNEVIGEIDFFSNDASGIGAASRGSISLVAQDAAGAGNMLFKTSNASSASAERMRILSTGGITFNGDTAQANALDDYEEGTWTPTVLFSSQSVGVVYTQQVGIYTKIGDLVTLFAEIRLSSKGSSTGSLQIGGLPFTPSLGAVNWVGGTTANFAFFSSLNSPPLPSVNNNQARITMRQLNNSAGLGTSDPLLTNNNVSNSMILGVTVTYKV